MLHLAHLIIVAAAVVLVSCRHPGYDTARYEQMQRVIEGSTNRLLGVSLVNATRLLSLDGVPWDAGYTSYPLGQYRIYHFRGFSLGLHLAVLPPGVSPDSPQSFSYIEPDLRRTGVWWVTGFYPALHIDQLDDRQQRMTNYWAGVQASFRERAIQHVQTQDHTK